MPSPLLTKVFLESTVLNQEDISRATALRLGCLFVFLAIASITGLIVTASRLRRSTANRPAHHALIVLLTGWLGFVIVAALVTTLKGPVAVNCVAVALLGVCAIIAFIQAVRGLVEIRENRDRYLEGGGPAITAIVLCVLMAAAPVMFFVFAARSGALLSKEGRSARSGPPEAPAIFEDLRFSVGPPHPWIRTDIKKLNPVAAVGFLRAKPEAYFIVIAEPLEQGSELPQETLVSVVKANLAGAATDLRVLEEIPEVLNGASGVGLKVHATVNGIPLSYRYWIHATPTVAYQLITWGHQRDHPRVMSEGWKALESFTLLPPK